MNLPGFTAEATVYRSSGLYRSMAVASDSTAAIGGIIPQLPRQMKLMQCLQGCSDAGSPDFCRDQCFWKDFGESGGGGGNGGGGPKPVCRPSCGPCLSVPGETGRWKTCVKRNCDTYDVRCA